MGTEGPPELTQFLTERAFHAELGWTDGIPLGDRPWRQVQEYALFISMLRREENRPRPKPR
jgi:hypothetical protein